MKMSLNESQIRELTEYIEELLDLYSEDEYEVYLENIVYHYCNRKFDIEREESTKFLYKIIEQLKYMFESLNIYFRING